MNNPHPTTPTDIEAISGTRLASPWADTDNRVPDTAAVPGWPSAGDWPAAGWAIRER